MKTFEVLLMIICFLSIIMMIIGFFKPSISLFFLDQKKRTRLFSFIFYFGLTALSSMLAPDSKSSSTPKEDAQCAVREYMKSHLNDPTSYEDVSWGDLTQVNETYFMKHSFRAKNGFGALMLSTKLFILSNKDNKWVVVSYGDAN